MPRKLHIGGTVRSDGWEVLNANAAPYVDHVCNANDLSHFAADTFEAIYASHVLEHLDYKDELKATLIGWNRVLVPGGKVYVSVPDIDVLAGLLLDKGRLTMPDRFLVMRMMFGGHVDRYDYHVVGLNEEFLAEYLRVTGYVNIQKARAFGLFEDASALELNGVAISLNMVAEKPLVPEPAKTLGRNAPCHCGSGRKYKHCHGKIS